MPLQNILVNDTSKTFIISGPGIHLCKPDISTTTTQYNHAGRIDGDLCRLHNLPLKVHFLMLDQSEKGCHSIFPLVVQWPAQTMYLHVCFSFHSLLSFFCFSTFLFLSSDFFKFLSNLISSSHFLSLPLHHLFCFLSGKKGKVLVLDGLVWLPAQKVKLEERKGRKREEELLLEEQSRYDLVQHQTILQTSFTVIHFPPLLFSNPLIQAV